MRRVILGTVTIWGIALTAAPVCGQNIASLGRTSTIGTGAQTIVNTPIAAGTVNSAFPGTQRTGFLASFFPGFQMPTSIFSFGQSNYPTPSSFASTQYPNAVPRPFVPVNKVPRYLLPDGYTPSLAPGR